jgi:esterase/lipase superfamily enzyme
MATVLGHCSMHRKYKSVRTGIENPLGLSSILRLARLALLSCILTAGCGAPPNLVDIETTAPVENVPDLNRHRIFVATSRAPSADPNELFSGVRGNELQYATVDVYIPQDRTPGSVNSPSRAPADPAKHFVIKSPVRYEERSDFRSDLTSYLRSRPTNQRDLLLYVHGYNTNTSSAILQIAQFVEDSGYDGVPVLFTWASSGNTLKYVYDMNSALVARDDLVSMFETMNIPAVAGYDVVAHSMGTFLVMEASRQIVMTTGLNPTGKVNNVVLAAPDIDIDLFKKQIELVPEDQRNIIVLVSKDDKALRASRRVAGGVSRVGLTDAAELSKLGVIAIDLSDVENTDTISHSKFKNSPQVVQQIGNSINSGESFNDGPRLGLGQSIAVTVEGTLDVLAPGSPDF